MVGGGNPFYLKFWVNGLPLERNRQFCRFRLLLVAPQPYDLAKKVKLTLIENPPRAFQRA